VTGAGASGGSSIRPEASVILQLTAGEPVQCRAFQNSGASQAIQSSANGYNAFAAVRLY